MINYWQSKTTPEKIIIVILGFFVILSLLFFGVFTPIHNMVLDQREELKNQKELLAWINNQAPIIKELRANRTKATSTDVFSILEEAFGKGTPLSAHVSLIRISDRKASINFTEVSFDDLIKQLVFLKKSANVNVDEIQVNRLEKPGLVEGRVILSK